MCPAYCLALSLPTMRVFRLVFAVAIVIGLAAAASLNSGDNPGKGRERSRVSQARSTNRGEAPRAKQGSKRVSFPDRIQYELNVGGRSVNVNAERANNVRSMKTVDSNGQQSSLNTENTEFYVDPTGGSYAVSASVDDNGHVTSKLSGRFVSGDDVIFMNGDTASSWTQDKSGPHLYIDGDEEPEVYDFGEGNFTLPEPSRRRRNVPVDEFDTSYTLELALFVDARWMRMFRRLAVDEEAAVQEAALYMTLLVNEINGAFRSIKTRSEETANIPDFEIAVYGVAMVYPVLGTEWNFVESALLSDTVIKGYGRCTQRTRCPYALDGFRIWLYRNWQELPFQWDHFAYITGYDLGSSTRSTGLLGVTNARYMCESNNLKFYSSSVSEEYVMDVMTTLAHEIGHSIGSDHDGTTTANQCSRTGYLMSQYAAPVQASWKDTIFTFSTCSVRQMYNHLNSMRLEGRDCLAQTESSGDDFKDQYCQGQMGEVFDVDFQCTQQFQQQADATACNLNTKVVGSETVKMVPANACWLTDAVKCKSNGASSCNFNLNYVSDGTPCEGSDPALDYACYNGACVEKEEICAGWDTTGVVNQYTTCDCSVQKQNLWVSCCDLERNEDGTCCNGCRPDTTVGDCTPT